MEQVRRIELLPAEPVDPPKEEEEQCATIRFDLPLTEPSESSCSEFSYVELVKKASSKNKEKNGEKPIQTNGASEDIFGEEHEDNEKLMALAMSFEAKYGPKPSKKKKAPRVQDLVDLGEGYDENDPFIDNSEAYDELVPATLTTKLGGFYINSGVLDFREVSEDSDAEFQVYRKKKKIKKKKLLFKEDGEIIKKKRKKLGSSDGEKPLKKKKLDGDFIKKRGRPKKVSPTVTEMLKQQQQQDSLQNNTNSQQPQQPPALSQDLYSSGSNMEESNLGNIDDAIDSVIARAAAEADTENAPVLPENLPSNLLQNIEILKQAAKQSADGKCKFFNTSVNNVLLNIELQVRHMSASTRQIVYGHLAAHLPCGQQTLVKRAKKLRLNEQGDKLREPLQKLKAAIDLVMPALWEEHNEECKAVAQIKSEKMEKDAKEGKEPKEPKEGKEEKEGSTESDDEKKEGEEGGEKEKRIMKPRKKFRWTDEIKQLLDNIVRIKMEMFESSKNKSQNAEDYLKDFLDKEVKDLWPKGWIQTRMLYKESRNVHGKWTNAAIVKPKKPVIPGVTLPTQPGQQPAQPGQVGTGVTNQVAGAPLKDEKPAVADVPSNPPAQTLLDYASEKYFNKGKSTASSTPSDVGKGSDSVASNSNQMSLSFTTTNMLRTPALEVLKNMGAMAGSTKKAPESQQSQSSHAVTSRPATNHSQPAWPVSSTMSLQMADMSIPPSLNANSSQVHTAVTMSNTSGKPITHQTVHPTSVSKTTASNQLAKSSAGGSSLLNKTVSSSQLVKSSNQLGKVSSSGHQGKTSQSSQQGKYPDSSKPMSNLGSPQSSSGFMSKFKEFAEKKRSPEQLKEVADHIKNKEPIPFAQNVPSSANWSGSKPSKGSHGHSTSSGQSSVKHASVKHTSVKPPSIGISNQQHQGSTLSQVYSNMQLPGASSFSSSKQSSHPPSNAGIVPVSSPGLHRTSPGSHGSHQSMSHTQTGSMHRPVPTKYTAASPGMGNSSPTVSSPTVSHMNKSPLSSHKGAHGSLQQNLHSSMKTSSVSSHHDQHKKASVSSNDSWSPTGQSIDQSFNQYAQQQQPRTQSTHSGFSASSLSPQSSGMRGSSGHSNQQQQQYRSSLSSNSPSTPDKLQQQQQKVSLSSSISPTEPLFGGMTLQQLEAQAMAAANMNRTPPAQAAALSGRSWHTGELTSSSSSAFTHPHASKISLPATTASLYHTAAGGLDNRAAANTYHGLNMFDLAQLGGRSVPANAHKVMSPDALLPPGGNLFSHQNLAGAGAALNPHGLSPQNKAYKNPPTQHRF